jgi:hypothetical protein
LSGNEARPQFQPDSLIRLLNLRSLWVDLLDINAGAAQVAEARGAALAIAEAPGHVGVLTVEFFASAGRKS